MFPFTDKVRHVAIQLYVQAFANYKSPHTSVYHLGMHVTVFVSYAVDFSQDEVCYLTLHMPTVVLAHSL